MGYEQGTRTWVLCRVSATGNHQRNIKICIMGTQKRQGAGGALKPKWIQKTQSERMEDRVTQDNPLLTSPWENSGPLPCAQAFMWLRHKLLHHNWCLRKQGVFPIKKSSLASTGRYNSDLILSKSDLHFRCCWQEGRCPSLSQGTPPQRSESALFVPRWDSPPTPMHWKPHLLKLHANYTCE